MMTHEISLWQTHVEERLGRRVRDFQLKFEHPGLVLHGRCGTYYVKQLVQHAVLEIASLPIAANRIDVVKSHAIHDDCDPE